MTVSGAMYPMRSDGSGYPLKVLFLTFATDERARVMTVGFKGVMSVRKRSKGDRVVPPPLECPCPCPCPCACPCP